MSNYLIPVLTLVVGYLLRMYHYNYKNKKQTQHAIRNLITSLNTPINQICSHINGFLTACEQHSEDYYFSSCRCTVLIDNPRRLIEQHINNSLLTSNSLKIWKDSIPIFQSFNNHYDKLIGDRVIKRSINNEVEIHKLKLKNVREKLYRGLRSLRKQIGRNDKPFLEELIRKVDNASI